MVNLVHLRSAEARRPKVVGLTSSREVQCFATCYTSWHKQHCLPVEYVRTTKKNRLLARLGKLVIFYDPKTGKAHTGRG